MAPNSVANEIAPGIFAPGSALRIQFSRAGGPGGQNVNKVNTKAELWLIVDQLIGLSVAAKARLIQAAGRRMTDRGELHLVCETERTASGNQRELLDRLREMILHAMIEPRRRRKTKPTRSSQLNRLQTKKRRSEIKSNRRSSDSNSN
ncbi:MAG: aminoacyl-tRNA hydrolase [Phycisphaerae bacterium]|nr:aminoacyl-tRNA hydrolase [Phycisphaerae bacterium]